MISNVVAAILSDMRAKADGAVRWTHRSTFRDFCEHYNLLQMMGVVERGADGALVVSRHGRDELLRWEHRFSRPPSTTRRRFAARLDEGS